MRRRIAALVAAGAFVVPASAHAEQNHDRVAFLSRSERTWELKQSYWQIKRNQARRWNLSRDRRVYVRRMLRSRAWHLTKRRRQLAWHKQRTAPTTAAPAAHGLLAPPSLVALGHELQAEGYMVGEHPAFGGVCACHAPNSRHYVGRALDINADGAPGGEMAALDRLASRLLVLGWHVLWRVAGHFDHLHVDY